MKNLYTLKVSIETYVVYLTQDYDEKFNMGHWKAAIIKNDHIYHVQQSIGSPMDGKITDKKAEKVFNDWKRRN